MTPLLLLKVFILVGCVGRLLASWCCWKFSGYPEKKDWVCKVGLHHWRVTDYYCDYIQTLDVNKICTKCDARWEEVELPAVYGEES